MPAVPGVHAAKPTRSHTPIAARSPRLSIAVDVPLQLATVGQAGERVGQGLVAVPARGPLGSPGRRAGRRPRPGSRRAAGPGAGRSGGTRTGRRRARRRDRPRRRRQMLRSRAGSAAPRISTETVTASRRASASAGRPAAMARHTPPRCRRSWARMLSPALSSSAAASPPVGSPSAARRAIAYP